MRIAIVGCGIGGMAAALALSRAGHDVTILERFDQPRPLGAGLLLQPTGLAALDALGVGERVRAAGAVVTRLHGRTPPGRTVLDLRYRGPHGIGVHRGVLFEALFDAVRPHVQIRADSRVEDIANPDGPAPAVLLAGGERLDGIDLVVVADGSASQLRAAILPRARAPEYPWGALWSIRPDPDGRWAEELRQVYDGCRVMIGVLPIGSAPGGDAARTPHVSLFWSLKTADLDAAQADGAAALQARIAAYWPGAAALLEGARNAEIVPARYRDVRAGRPVRKAVAVIGDAAHGMSPQLGQGANMALIDALELARQIGPADRPGVPARSLRAYAARRARHAAYYRWMSRLLTPVFQSDSRLIAWLRDRLLGPMCRAPLFGAVMRATLSGRANISLRRWRGAWEADR